MTERAVNEDTPTLENVRAAMDRGELFVEYQPIVSLVTQRCVGAEALVRWLRGGTIWPASRFVALIENTPLSGRLTYWVIDTIAPDTSITSMPPDPSASITASFAFVGDDGSGTGVTAFECSIDGGPFLACTSPHTLTDLADGTHTFAVRAVDAAGHTDATPAMFTLMGM